MSIENLHLTIQEKGAILRYIQQGNIELIKYLPYFYNDDSHHLTGETAVEVVKLLSYDFNEDNPDTQERMYNILDKVMDGIGQIRYKRDKEYFRFKNINEINTYMLKVFSKINEHNQAFCFQEIANLLNQKINDSKYYEKCLLQIAQLYHYYQQNHSLSQQVTTTFYNQILNRQMDAYIGREKQKMIEKLITEKKLPYTRKKEKGVSVSIKLRKIDTLLASGNYKELGITKEELLKSLEDYDEEINSIKLLRKEQVSISKEKLIELNEMFATGKLTLETISAIIPGVSSEIITKILNKYTLKKMQFLDSISLSQEELTKELNDINLGYNYNNYKIGTVEKTTVNIIRILENLSEEDAQDIISHGDIPEELKQLLPMLDYFDDFDEIEMIALLKNYPRIINKMVKEKIIDTKDWNKAIRHFSEIMEINNAYDSVDDIVVSILGKDILEKILDSDKITSRNPMDYVTTYKQMLKKETTFIPPVSGKFLDCYYESAQISDRERLLIGKNCSDSCIGPAGSGEKAYIKALTEPDADVIMIKDSKTNNFIARSLCFRKGNYVVLAPVMGREGLAEEFYNPGFLSIIATKMLNQAQEKQDNLEYIFISPDGRYLNEYYPLIENSYLSDPFPHASLDEMGYLIGSIKDTEKVEIDSTLPMNVQYQTTREKIKGKNDITSEELTRLKALDISLTVDKAEKEEKSRSFEEINIEKYDEIYKGQDWYIGMKNGEIIDEVILPTNQRSQQIEISILKSQLETIKMLTEDRKEAVFESNRGGKK